MEQNNQVGQADQAEACQEAADQQGSEHVENCGCPECDVCDCGCGQSGSLKNDFDDFSLIRLSPEPLPYEPSISVNKIDQAVTNVLVQQGRMTGEQAKALLREERRKRRLAERGY